MANKQIDYANIKETKDVAGAAVSEEKKIGFGLDDQAQEKNEAKKQGKRFDEKNIQFTGKPPQFKSRKAGGIGKKGDFDVGLDDLEDDGTTVKEKPKRNTTDDG